MIKLDIDNILITGSTGYLGKNLYDHLASKNYNVTGLHHRTRSKDQRSVTGDLLDRTSLTKAIGDTDCIVHCGALVGGNRPGKDYEVNSKGTGNLLDISIKNNVKKIIHISTLAVVDEFIDHFDDDETIPYAKRYRNQYTQSKIRAEQHVLSDKGKIDVIILRPGWIWGPGEKSTIAMFDMVSNNKFRFIGDGRNLTYFTNIENMKQMIELAIKSDLPSGEIFNVTDGEKITMHEFIKRISDELSAGPVRKHIPKWAAYFAAYVSEKVVPDTDLTRQNVSIMSNNLHFNIDKARRKLGYRPMDDPEAQIRKCLKVKNLL